MSRSSVVLPQPLPPHNGDQLTLGEGHVDAIQYGAAAIRKIDIADFDQRRG